MLKESKQCVDTETEALSLDEKPIILSSYQLVDMPEPISARDNEFNLAEQSLPSRLSERHFPKKFQACGSTTALTRRRCVVCSRSVLKPRVRKETRYECRDCKKALCIVPCFEEYHSLLNF